MGSTKSQPFLPSSTASNTTSLTSPNPKRLRGRMTSNYQVMWVDATIEQRNDDVKNSLTQLGNIISDVHLCTTSIECIEFLKKMDNEKAFVISSGSLGQQLVKDIHDMPQLDVIYIFCCNKEYHEQWAKAWPKIRGVFTSIEPLCESLTKVIRENDHDSIPMSFMPKETTTDSSDKKNLDRLEPTYMYSVIFKGIILEIKDDDKQMEALVAYCREQDAPIHELNDFQRQYQQKSPVWWYTKEMFLYRMLNKALWTFDMKGMVKMGFFIRHLHLQLKKLHEQQAATFKKQFTVYRGQGFSPEDFQDLLASKGGLLSFHNFLSTSKEQHVADGFIQRAMAKNTETIGVLFVMTIDPRKISTTTTPYALIDGHSAIPSEQEILFTMHTVFRVNDIKPLGKNNRLHEVQLTIADDSDPDLTRLTDYINKEFTGHGWYRMGRLMLQVGDFDQAEVLYNDLLEKASTDNGRSYIYHQLGWVKHNQGKYEEAAKYYEESLRIKLKTTPEDDISLANTYNNIGLAYNNMGDYKKALQYYEKASTIKQKHLSPTNLDLALIYNNIGLVYNNMGDYSKALEYYEKSLKIREKALPPTHPDSALIYNNIGLMCNNMGDYSKALEYYEKSLKIREKALPPTHPDLATSYSCIGGVYNNMGDYSKALEYYEKSLKIREKALPPTHPDLATSYSCIGGVYNNMGDYSKALEYYEKSLKIREKALPPTHPDLATSYSCIGGVYNNMGDYSKALEYYEKDLEITKKALPPTHPDLAISYNNISSVYYRLGDYKKALEFSKKDLEIKKESLPENHPDLAVTHSRFGRIYRKLKDYSKALENFEKSCEIREKSLPEKHPHIAITYSNIGDVHRLMGNYEKALKFHQKALNIQENVKCNPLDSATTYMYLGETYREMKDYSTALKYYQKGLKIREEKLSKNHPDLAEIYHNMSKLYYSTRENNLAMKYIQQAIEIGEEKLSSNHPNLLEYRETLEKIHNKKK